MSQAHKSTKHFTQYRFLWMLGGVPGGLFLPKTLFAQGNPPITLPPRALTLVGNFYDAILNPIIVLLFGLAFLYFIFGVVKYVLHGDQQDVREEGRRAMLWGIIGMFIMFSVFGILKLVIGSMGLNPTQVLGTV